MPRRRIKHLISLFWIRYRCRIRWILGFGIGFGIGHRFWSYTTQNLKSPKTQCFFRWFSTVSGIHIEYMVRQQLPYFFSFFAVSGNPDAPHITAIAGDKITLNCDVNFPNGDVSPYVVQWWRKVSFRPRTALKLTSSSGNFMFMKFSGGWSSILYLVWRLSGTCIARLQGKSLKS